VILEDIASSCRTVPMTRARANPADPRVRQRHETLRDAKRQMVIEAARRVFQSHGLEGASIRLIAAEAGCTTGAIYPYFKGKEEIYAALLSESLEGLRAFIAGRIEAATDRLERARCALEAFYSYYRANPAELSLGLYLFRGPGVRPVGLNPDLNRALNAQLAESFDLMVHAIEAAGFDQARDRAADGICHAVGLLIIAESGRMRVFKAKPEGLMRSYVDMALPPSP
jgi:TetR/AcrR family transcriptional regulator